MIDAREEQLIADRRTAKESGVLGVLAAQHVEAASSPLPSRSPKKRLVLAQNVKLSMDKLPLKLVSKEMNVVRTKLSMHKVPIDAQNMPNAMAREPAQNMDGAKEQVDVKIQLQVLSNKSRSQ